MDLEQIKSHKIKMILGFSIPSIISMVLTALITIVDGFFIGNYIGKEGLAAVNLGCPIIYLFLGIGLMFSVGGISISGRLFGAGKNKECNNVFNQTNFTVVIVSIVLSLLVYIFFTPIKKAVGVSGLVEQYFNDYYLILLFELPLMIINSSLGMFIRGEGSPAFYMNSNILNVVLNIILDYVFTVRLGWSVKGIAFASLISTFITLIMNMLFFAIKSKLYKFARFSFCKKDFMETLFNGSSEFIGEMAMCVSMYAYNFIILRKIGIEGITAFTIVGYVSYIFSMIIVGFGQGIVPLIGFSYGAKNWELAKKIRNTTICFVVGSGVFVMILMLFASSWYSRIFTKEQAISSMIKSGILIYMFSFPLAGFNTIASFYFTSIGKAKESAVISFSRGLFLLLINIFILPSLFGMTGVWFVGPVTESVTLILSCIFMLKEKNKQI